jgi:hypothetical protein
MAPEEGKENSTLFAIKVGDHNYLANTRILRAAF